MHPLVEQDAGARAYPRPARGSSLPIAIRAEFGEHVPVISADRVQLQQVLMNLMLNGIAMDAS